MQDEESFAYGNKYTRHLDTYHLIAEMITFTVTVGESIDYITSAHNCKRSCRPVSARSFP